jgi:hypothetical protein
MTHTTTTRLHALETVSLRAETQPGSYPAGMATSKWQRSVLQVARIAAEGVLFLGSQPPRFNTDSMALPPR